MGTYNSTPPPPPPCNPTSRQHQHTYKQTNKKYCEAFVYKAGFTLTQDSPGVVCRPALDRSAWWIDFHYEMNRRQEEGVSFHCNYVLEALTQSFFRFCRTELYESPTNRTQRQPKGEVERPSCSPISG